MNDEERIQKIGALCGMIDQLGEDNGSGEQFLSALTICAGMYLRRMPDPHMRMTALQNFLRNVRRMAGGRHDDS